MAKTKRPVSRRAAQEAQIRRLRTFDILGSGAISAAACGAAFVVWVLANAELISSGTALPVAAGLVLFAVLHGTLRVFISERTTAAVAIAVLGFAAVWMAVILYPIAQITNPSAPLFASDLHAQAPPVSVPLHGAAGSYRLVVEGHFPPGADRASHSAHYRLHVKDGADVDRVFDGDFSESWRRQRLGRRGGVSVRVGHTLAQHAVASPSGSDFTLQLDEMAAGGGDSVHVEVYRDTMSTGLFAALGAALVGAGLVIDAWRGMNPGDGLVTMETLSALFCIVALRTFASPHPGFGDLGTSALLAMLAGLPAGALLWRAARPQLRRVVAPPGRT